jgi:predicted RNA-binding protein YlxR (DUF448 family)
MEEAEREIQFDQGRRNDSAATERLCIATRAVRPIDELIRFVAGPDGVVVPDIKRKLPGRGVWVTARRGLVAQATRRDAFGRAFKTAGAEARVRAPVDLPDFLDRLLMKAALDALSVTRKAGLAIMGFAKIEAAIAGGIAVLIRASDAGEDGRRKLVAALRRAGRAEDIPIVEVFTSAQLDLAFGRPNVVHAALFAGRPSETFLRRWRILEIYRADAPVGRGLLPTDAKAPELRLQNQDRND